MYQNYLDWSITLDLFIFFKKMDNFTSFYLKKKKRIDRFICRGTGRKPVQCTNVVMEYDHIGHTTTANLATHTKHRHTKRAAPRLPHSVIIVTPPRASDSDFVGDFPNSAPQTAPEPMPAHATNWPHAPRTDSSDSDDELHKGIMLNLRRPSTLQTTPGRSSSPQ
jgi:hypothetical protein